MIFVEWPQGVNQKFYSYKKAIKENDEIISFIGGREIGYQKNTRKQHIVSCKIKMTKSEYETFLSWYNVNLGGRTGAFTCSALGSEYWQFVNTPEPQEAYQKEVELNIDLQEYY